MDHSIIILYFPNKSFLTINLHYYSKTLKHSTFSLSYDAKKVAVFIGYSCGSMVVATNDEWVWVDWELMWSVVNAWGFVRWPRRENGADDLEASTASWGFIANANSVYYYIGGKVLTSTLCAVAFLLLVGTVSLGCKFEKFVRFNPGCNPFRNRHDRSHPPFLQLVSLTCFLGSLGDHQHCGGCYHHHDDYVEVICCQECRQ